MIFVDIGTVKAVVYFGP